MSEPIDPGTGEGPTDPTAEEGTSDMNSAAWETNMKNVVDSHVQLHLSTLSELVLSQQQIRSQQAQMFQSSEDKIRDNNLISHLASGGFKTIEEKLLDPDATEVASQALAAATATTTGMQQSMTAIAASLTAMTASMEQMNSRLESVTRPAA